ncbi:unnamed protein product [Rotaria sp. Silwood1]|nr:unnamed protein product [Rotaria sp. Silwood1]
MPVGGGSSGGSVTSFDGASVCSASCSGCDGGSAPPKAYRRSIRHQLDLIEAQQCQNASSYTQCSLNPFCGCLQLATNSSLSICASLHLTCSSLAACANNNQMCYQPNYVRVKHEKCHKSPLCYPLDLASQIICPSIRTTTTPSISEDGICASATWNQNGITVAGGNGQGSELNQLDYPLGLFRNEDDAIYVADSFNHRIVKWLPRMSTGQIVAGGKYEGNSNEQLNDPSSVVIDKNGTMFICDRNNKRVQQWFQNANSGQTLISNISCWGLAMDSEGSLYISSDDNRVTKWPSDQVVAGGQGTGNGLNQLSKPNGLFVDRNQSLFIADSENHRIMKWPMNAKKLLWQSIKGP